MKPGASEDRIVLERGTLWKSVVERTARALDRGAIRSIPTRSEVIEQEGIRFLVRIVANLDRKHRAGLAQMRTGRNPFLPYDEDLFVAEITDTHVCLLNKYNVVEHHLLIVTRAFEDQESRLTLRDFEAMWVCLAEFDGLAFYNAGAVAGASQRHKHLQQVPVPLSSGPERTPIDALLAGARFDGRLGIVRSLGFVHTLARAGSLSGLPPAEAAERTLTLYEDMLRAVGLEGGRKPYNLVVTREWLLLVPRAREHYHSFSVNALGFAGALLVRNEAQLDVVRRQGPMKVLRHVGIPSD